MMHWEFHRCFTVDVFTWRGRKAGGVQCASGGRFCQSHASVILHFFFYSFNTSLINKSNCDTEKDLNKPLLVCLHVSALLVAADVFLSQLLRKQKDSH